MGTPLHNFIVGSCKYHTFYKEICKTWILDIIFWIIVPWSLKTVEIVTNTGKNTKNIHTWKFFVNPSKELLENIA